MSYESRVSLNRPPDCVSTDSLKRRLVLCVVALAHSVADVAAGLLSRSNNVLVVVLHMTLADLNRLLHAACVVHGGLCPHEDVTLHARVVAVVVRVRVVLVLLLRALVERALVLELALGELRGSNLVLRELRHVRLRVAAVGLRHN